MAPRRASKRPEPGTAEAGEPVTDSVVPYVPTSQLPYDRPLRAMQEVTHDEYERYLDSHDTVLIEGKSIRLEGRRRVKTFGPKEENEQTTTVWSFPDRGKWATHKASYRGNWSPWVPRNLILKYSNPGDTVLDQMVGGGTTLVECRLTGRRGIGVDISRDSLMLALDRLNFEPPLPLDAHLDGPPPEIRLFEGDACHLDAIPDDSVDLVATHPPYANIIPYSRDAPIKGDLSQIHTLNEFFDGMELVAAETFRVLKPGGYVGLLIGDTHRHAHYVPMAYRTLALFLQAGFVLKEDVIKLQHNVETARTRWRPWFLTNFLQTMHEHLFIFRKLGHGEDARKFAASKYTAGGGNSLHW